MADGVLYWAKKQVAEWKAIIPKLESGEIGTFEVRGGMKVDTTQETIVERKMLLENLSAIIAKHEGK